MSETTLLESRLSKVEQDNRRLKLTVGALLLVMAAVPLVGAVMPEQVPELITARAFHVIDENGEVRTAMDDTGFMAISVWKGLQGEPDTRSQMNLEGDGISFRDGNGTLRTEMNMTHTIMNDENGEQRWFLDKDMLRLYSPNPKGPYQPDNLDHNDPTTYWENFVNHIVMMDKDGFSYYAENWSYPNARMNHNGFVYTADGRRAGSTMDGTGLRHYIDGDVVWGTECAPNC